MAVNPLSQLTENIQGSISGLLGNAVPNVPQIPVTKAVEAVLSNLDQANWSKLAFPYTFSVVDSASTGTLTTFSSPSFAPDNPFTDFSLPLAPQSIHQTEEFAISIKPTQGGTTVTHSGNRYKTLSIKGTTGVHPFRGAGGVNKRTGEAIFQPKELKYSSGYEVFMQFRNWLKAYYEFKKDGANTSLRLIFKNYKDGEFLIVECTKFEMSRQAARSFLYDYDMEFKVLAHFKFEELPSETSFFDALDKANELLDTARGVMLRVQNILRQVESIYNSVVLEPLRKLTLTIKTLRAIPTLAADIGARIIQNTLSTGSALLLSIGIKTQQDDNKVSGTLDPRIASIPLPDDLEATVNNQGPAFIETWGEGLMAIPSSAFTKPTREAHLAEQQELIGLPRSFYEDTLTELSRVKDNLEDFLGLGDATYDQIFDRTATLSADPAKVPTVEELELLNAFNDAIRGVELVLASEDLFKANFDKNVVGLVGLFNGDIPLQSSPAVRQVLLKSGDTLERLAQRHLGDSNRWGEIAEVNFLQAPYITNDLSSTDPKVKKVGQKILIPTGTSSGFSSVPEGKQTAANQNVDAVLKSLGTDLRLNADFDLELTATGDFSTVSGTDNMAQAVILKLSYERGEVMRYPNLGASVVPGSKFPPLTQIRDGVVNTLLQDPRIERITDLKLTRDNSALTLEFNLFVKNVDLPISLSIILDGSNV